MSQSPRSSSLLPLTSIACFALLYPENARGADEWSNPAQRAAWSEALEVESTGPSSSAVLYNEAGSVAGLHGDFPIPDAKVSTIRAWIYAHREMLGILPNEFVDPDTKTPFFEALPDGPDNVYSEQTGTVFWFSAVIGDVKANPGTFKVFVDKRTGSIRGLYSSFEPTTEGYSTPNIGFTEGKAWDAVETLLGTALIERLSATQLWSSVGWLLERKPGKKELLWLVQGQTASGNVENFIVSPSGVLHREGGIAWLGGPIPQTHRGYTPSGDVYWQSNSAGGCNALGPGCTNPAFGDSLITRVNAPLVALFWSNLSSQNFTGTYLDWPWTGPNQAPLKSLQKTSVSGTQQSMSVTLAHPGSLCRDALGRGTTPCGFGESGAYSIVMGAGDTEVGILGHEFGHAMIRDLKRTSHNQMETNPALRRASQLTEAVCDYIGIVQEDFTFKAMDPNPSAQRTDFSFSAPSNGLVLNWPTSACIPALNTSRLGLGYAWFQAWKKMGAYITPHARRDVLFRAWQASILIAYFYTTNDYPTPLDMAAAHLAMVPTPLYNYGNQPYPNSLLAYEVIRELSQGQGCW